VYNDCMTIGDSRMGSKLTALGLAAAFMATTTPAAASDRDWANASDVAVGGLLVAALGVPAINNDWNGTLQAGASAGAAFGIAAGLKEAFPETRPDHSNRKSFPSGHSATAFGAAASLQNRYGWQAGLPAQLVAAFVGVARVKADKHHWYDAVAGAAVGEASGFLITSRRDDRVKVFPWAESKGGGVAVAMRF
jgi:membrane-associated phospholipid phosphatase